MPDLPEDINSKIRELEVLLETEPSPELYSKLADLYRTNGQLEHATEVCEKALKNFPDDVNCLMTYARVLSDTGMLEEAEGVLRKIIDLGGEDAGTLIMLGQLYVQRNDLAGIHSIATKLFNNFPGDVRAKKFLGFLKSRNLLPAGIDIEQTTAKRPDAGAPSEPIVITPEMVENGVVQQMVQTKSDIEPETAQQTATTPAEAQPPPKPEAKSPAKRKLRKPPTPKIPTIAVEDVMRVISMLKGITGVQHVVLTDPWNKTLASKGCPGNIARAVGGMTRSFKKAMYVAFDALDFGNWIKGVVELERTTIHLIEIEGYWIALLCEKSVSLGALRIAVNSIISRHLRTRRMR